MVVRVSRLGTQHSKRRCLQVLALLLLPTLAIAASTAALAAGESSLPDPTRPPVSMSGAIGAALGEQSAFSEPQLQSVMIGTTGRSAIIGGRRYQLGDRVGDAKLVKISEGEVVLAGASGRRTMTLFPSVKKRVDAPVTNLPNVPKAQKRSAEREASRKAAASADVKADPVSGLGGEPNTGLNAGLNSSRSR